MFIFENLKKRNVFTEKNLIGMIIIDKTIRHRVKKLVNRTLLLC